METRAVKRAREQHQSAAAAAHQPAAHETAVHEGGSQQPDGTDDPPTHLLSLPHHLISDLILPRVSSAKDCCAFLGTCKAAHSMSSTHTQANWLQQNRPATALYLAATFSSGSDALMLELLNRPGVLEKSTARDKYGNPLLVCASMHGDCQVVRVLLQRGMDANTADKYGHTSLMAAAFFGRASVVETLLQADGINQVKVEQADASGRTALYWAASAGCAHVVPLLLQAGSPVNARSHAGGFTPLHLACMYNHPAVVQELLQHPDVNTALQNSDGDTPLVVARKKGHAEIVAILEQHALGS